MTWVQQCRDNSVVAVWLQSLINTSGQATWACFFVHEPYSLSKSSILIAKVCREKGLQPCCVVHGTSALDKKR
jgi:hypothetical protein